MPALLKVLFTLALSSGGRKAVRALLRYLKSEDGKKLVEQARRARPVRRHSASASRSPNSSGTPPSRRGSRRTAGGHGQRAAIFAPAGLASDPSRRHRT